MFYYEGINDYNNFIMRYGVNTFHEHSNGQGSYFTMSSGDSTNYVGDVWNDRVSSVTIAPRTLIILFSDRNFYGETHRVVNYGNSSKFYTLPRDWSDRTTSIETYNLA
ncbi:peptidase inhibitor family I36 protein [Bacillus cereus]|uniref:peptidase inhibitor family I36 protein n=1 Tax=Bacillus cereus TaxID=1396 RepID=UPI0009445FA2|nr:peptidase inhibitor family I36 protein [Bacillus cereus]